MIDVQSYALQLRREGFTILPPQLTTAQCDEARLQLDRLDNERARGGFELLFNKAAIFERLYRVPTVLALVRYMLGADALLSAMHGSLLRPGEGKGGLHADGAITGHNRAASMAPADEGRRITSHVMALNSIWCISEFTATNGATQLVPGSHLHEGFGIPQNAVEQATIVEAPRGAVILFDVNTWHGPSENRSGDNRYAVLNPWRRHWQRCEYEMASVVHRDVLRRSKEEHIVFGVDAVAPHVERWQWDAAAGAPKAESAQTEWGDN
jgi:ectoine hydroxylase-related dioxygenase (phytanoyl-CoA dioxygenase family)